MVKQKIRSIFSSFCDATQGCELARQVFKVAWHFAGVPVTFWLSFLLRFDGTIPYEFHQVYWHSMPILMGICLLSFLAFRLFYDVWTYFSVDDLVRMTSAVALAMFIFAVLIFTRPIQDLMVPRSVVVLEFILLNMWLGGGRIAARYMRRFRGVNVGTVRSGTERLLLVGDLDEADRIIRESHRTGLGQMVAVIGADTNSQNVFLHGLRMPHGQLGDVAEIVSSVRPDTILIMPPYNRPRQINAIMEQVSETGIKCAFRTIPSLTDLASGQLTASSIRNVDIEDLLERGQVEFDRSDVRRSLKGKTVMITGAGGSIGSEIARQVSAYEPECLVLFDQSEFGLYSVEQEIERLYPNLKLISQAGDIRQKDSVRNAFDVAGKVDVVYHAAAYKHVPLMEKNVAACFQTNVLGTAVVARESIDAGVERFVMISSDKAVRPTSIMGVAKRLAEMVLDALDTKSTTVVSVRFGNVLGSSGSVVPLFKKQIAMGGPVTVTGEEVRRFFMTIPEAVDLVLQAGTVGRNKEVMVLEMGEDIRIVDLAHRLIALSGLTAGKDIEVKIIGMRPGEKQYEEVMTKDENVLKTAYEKIWVIKKNPDHKQSDKIDLNEIAAAVSQNDDTGLRRLAVRYVPDNCFDPIAGEGMRGAGD